jgi:glycosyltransferase involved in cell wall biosynthesis
MLLSVIVPVFNAQETLDRCVRSVLDQDFKDVELILVDDGSRDNSPRMCDEYASSDRRVVVVHQENRGVGCTRTEGIRKAQGEYLVHLDCDDFFLENGLSMLVEQIRQRPDAEMYVWHILLLQHEAIQQECVDFPDTARCCVTGEQAFGFLFCSNKGVLWQVYRYVTKRSFVIENNLFYRAGVIHEDVDFNPYMVLCAKRVHFCSGAYYVYWCGREGAVTSRVTAARCKDMILLVKRWFEFLTTAQLAPFRADGFRAELSRNLWNYVPAVLRFPNAVRNELFDLLEENKAILMWVRIPRVSAFAKRRLLVCVGVKFTARTLGLIGAIRKRVVSGFRL